MEDSRGRSVRADGSGGTGPGGAGAGEAGSSAGDAGGAGAGLGAGATGAGGLTGESLLEAVEADGRALAGALGTFEQQVRQFAAVAEVVEHGRPTIHTRAPAVPVGLFAAGQRLVAAFDVPAHDAPEVADLLRVYIPEGRGLRPAPNPFAHHKGLTHWISDLYLSHRGRVSFVEVIERSGQVALIFSVSHGEDSAPRRHVLGLDLSAGLDDIKLVRSPRLPERLEADFTGLPELDLAPWKPGTLTSAYYFHTRVGPLYTFVDWGTLKLRDKLDTPRGAADVVVPGAADTEQSVNPHRAEVLWPALERESGEALVRIEPSAGRPLVYVYYSAHPRRFARFDPTHQQGLNLPEDLGKISSMFLWTGGQLSYLGGLQARPVACLEAPGSAERLYVFQQDDGPITLHHFDPEKRRVLHSFYPLTAYTLLPDGHLYFIEASSDEPTPALEHPLACYITPFRAASDGYTAEEQRFLRSFDAAAVESLAEAVRGIAPALEARELRPARDALDRILVEYPFVERAEGVRDGIHRLHASLSRCIGVEDELADIHTRRREAFQELAAEVEASEQARESTGIADLGAALEAVAGVRGLLGRLERAAAERFLPPDVLEAIRELRDRLIDRLRDLSQAGATQATQRVEGIQARLEALDAQVPGLTELARVEAVEAQVQADVRQLTATVEALQLLDLEPSFSLELARQATSGVVSGDRLEAALRARRRELSRARKHEQFSAYIIQLDMRIATEPRGLAEVDACDGRLDALVAEIETRKGDFADFPELVDRLEERVVAARRRYEARKLELLRARDQAREEIEAQFRLRLHALGTAARAVNLPPAAMEGFLATHPEAVHCATLIDTLDGLGFAGEAAALRGRLDQLKRLIISERQEAATFAIEGETLRLASIRLHRNRLTPSLREVQTAGGVGLALTGTGLVLEPERLGGLRAPIGYRGLINEATDVSRPELLAFRALERAEAEGWPALEAEAALPEREAIAALEARCRALALAHPDEELILGMHDRDAALILRAVVPRWGHLGRLRWPSSLRMAAVHAWSKVADPAAVTARARSVQALARVLGGANQARSVLREALETGIRAAAGREVGVAAETGTGTGIRAGNGAADETAGEAASGAGSVTSPGAAISDEALDYLEAELEAGGLETPAKLATHPRANAVAAQISAAGGPELHRSLEALGDSAARLTLLRPAVEAWMARHGADLDLVGEVALILATGLEIGSEALDTLDVVTVPELASDHPRTREPLTLHLPGWRARMQTFVRRDMPAFERFRDALERVRRELELGLELESLNPRPLARFVWTRLMRRAYLPPLAAALEKQLGSLDRPGQDQMGLLLLVSPPGYGKTELLKKIAALLGYAFVSVSGTALGKETRSLDPSAAPDGNAAAALNRLMLGLELRENVVLDIEDVQACSDAFLSRLLPLCDATRTVEIVREGRTRLIDLQGRRVVIVMTLNPLHATIPQALANRATLVNLGEAADKHAADFALSYLEVAAPANATLEAAAMHQDLETFAQALAEGRPFGSLEADLNGRYARAELSRIQIVLEHCVAVRDVLIAVNRACLESASIQEAFRTDPAFELQGSYRDMIEICRSIESDWSAGTRLGAILRHYEGQAGLLGAQGEFNLLSLKALLGQISSIERERLAHIREVFRLAQQRDRAVYVLMERLAEVSTAVERVPSSVATHGETLAGRLEAALERASSEQATGEAARLERLELAVARLSGMLAEALEQGVAARLEQAVGRVSEAVGEGLAARVEVAVASGAAAMAARLDGMELAAVRTGEALEGLTGRLELAVTAAGETFGQALDRPSAAAQALAGSVEAVRLELSAALEALRGELAGLPPTLMYHASESQGRVVDALDRLVGTLRSTPLPVAIEGGGNPDWAITLNEAVGGLRNELERASIAVVQDLPVRLLEANRSGQQALREALLAPAAMSGEIAATLRGLREEVGRLPALLSAGSSDGRQAMAGAIERLSSLLETGGLAVSVQGGDSPAWAAELHSGLEALRIELARLALAADKPRGTDMVGLLKALVKSLPEGE